MIIRHKELDVDEKDPFLNCKFGRNKYASILTDIVGSYADGFVLAINNKWGTGKTTFLKMWQQSLVNNEFKVCYFNAWEHDFDKNPMVAVISELKAITNSEINTSFKSLLQKGAVLLKNIVPA